MNRKTRLLAVALIAIGGCSRCGKTQGRAVTSPAELAPPGADAVVYVPHLLTLGQHAQRVSQLKIFGLLASLAGAGNDGQAFLKQFEQQLGFDFTSAQGLSAVGLAPDGPLLSAHSREGVQVAVVTVADDGRFDEAATRLAKERLRAPVRGEHQGMVTFAPTRGQPVLAYAHAGKYAVLAAGPQCTNAVRAALAQDAAHSLAADADYEAWQDAHAQSDLLLFAPAQNPFKDLGLTGGLKLAATLQDHQAVAELELPLDTAQATALATLHGSAGQELVGQLDPDAFLVARTALDPATLWPIVETQVPAPVRQQLLNVGVRMGEVLANVKPGAALSLALPDATRVNLSRMPSFDPRETNPFRYVYLAALGQVKDPAAAAHTLSEVQKFGPQIGASVATRLVGKVPVYTFKYQLGEGASVALDGERVVISGGEGRMAPLLGRAPGAGYKLPAELAPRFDGAGLAVWFDMARVISSLRALPDSAFGLGGFAIKSALDRWLDALGDFKGGLLLADTRASSKGSVLHVEVQADLP